MLHYQYLIIGGGMTADAAIVGMRQVDPTGSIGLISAESHLPYNRPPLSKGLWKDKPLEKVFRKGAEQGVETHLGKNVVSLDIQHKQVADEQGEVFTYEKLLLATGGTPRRLPFGGDHIMYFRTLDDYLQLRQAAERGGKFAVIGGGFIGSEIAAALAMNGQSVTMVFPKNGIAARLFPADLVDYINDYYRHKGVEVLNGEMIGGFEERGEKLVLLTKSGKQLVADSIVAGLGIKPNIELAQTAGIAVEDGITVDEYLRTSQPHVYAAGDVASFFNPALGRRMRVEHEDNALMQGRIAGRNMAGEALPYHHLPYFYSDLFDLGYEAVGEMDPQLEVFTDWQELYHKGVIYYLKEGRVRGVLLWNVWDQVQAARRLIAELGPFEAGDLKGRLPE